MGLWILGAYALLLLGMGWLEHRRAAQSARSDDAFFVNSRTSGTGAVALSIVASCVGGSATLGMVGLAWEVGTPAFWWLGSGALGLIVLTLCLARRVRASGARTMPELTGMYLGEGARQVASAIIVVAWMAILAAQFSALAAIVASMTGMAHVQALWSGAGVIIAYSVLGGQAAVIRSDAVQYVLLTGGLMLALVWLLGANPSPHPLASVPLELVNEHFSTARLIYYLLILGGSYVVCPMLFGRLLSARDATTARRGGLWGVVGLLLTAALIVLVGLACRGLVPAGTPPEQVLTTAIGLFPDWLRATVLVALFSAIVSSADSCLLTAATVCGNDLFRSANPQVGARGVSSVAATTTSSNCLFTRSFWARAFAACSFSRVAVARAATMGLGAGGLVLASSGKGILGLLLMANDIYVCGVVAPVFVGMLARQPEQPEQTKQSAQSAHMVQLPQSVELVKSDLPHHAPVSGLMVAAMLCGGGFGLGASLSGSPVWSYCGLATSTVLALAAVWMPRVRLVIWKKFGFS